MDKRLAHLLSTSLVLGAAGCGDLEAEFNRIIGSDYDIELTGRTPPIPFSLGEQVGRLENRINERKNNGGDDKRNYDVLKALCETDPGAGDCTTARFPARVPRYMWPAGCIVRDTNNIPSLLPPAQCTMPMTCETTPLASIESGMIDPMNPPAGNGCVDIAEWLSEVDGFEDLTKIAYATAFDISKEGSLNDVSQVKKVIVKNVVLRFDENSLTYEVPLSRYYVGAPVSESAAADAKGLIANGTVTEFGTLNSVPAAFTGARAMSLQTEGKAVLSDAIKGFRATMAAQAELQVPPMTDAGAADNCRDPNTTVSSATACESFPKPGGDVKLVVELTAVFTVNPSGN